MILIFSDRKNFLFTRFTQLFCMYPPEMYAMYLFHQSSDEFENTQASGKNGGQNLSAIGF